MATYFKQHYPEFNDVGFIRDVTSKLNSLALKERTQHITAMITRYFPTEFEQAGHIMLASLGETLSDDLSHKVIDNKGVSG